MALLLGVASLLLGRELTTSRQSHREMEERYRALSETAPVSIFLVDRDQRVQDANGVAAQQLGRGLDEIIGKPVAELFPEQVRERHAQDIRSVFETDQTLHTEDHVQFADREIYLDTMLVPIRDAAGKPRAVMGMARDITQRKLIEEDRLRLRLGIERSGEAIFMTDPDGTIIYVNPAFEKIYGYSQEEVLGKTPRIIKSGVLSQENYVHFWNTLLAKQIVSGEIINKTKDGRLLNIDGSANPILNEQGDIIGFLAIQRDITDRKRAEIALRESEEQYRLLFEGNPHPMWVYDLETLAFLAVNNAAIHHYGYSRDEFLAMTIKDIRPTEDIPALLDSIRKAPTGMGESGIWRHRKKDSSIIFVEITSHTTTFVGKPAKLVLANDVTERKRAERQVQTHLNRLSVLHMIDTTITSSFDLRVILNFFLEQVNTQLDIDASAVLLLQPATQTLEYAATRGFRSNAFTRASVRLNDSYAGRAIMERRVIQIRDQVAPASSSTSKLLASERFVVYFGVPLIVKGQVMGVLELFHRASLDPDQEWLGFLETLATQAAIAIDNMSLFKDLQRSNAELSLAYDATLEGWSRALDLRDKETEGHTQRVSEWTVRLARRVGTSDSDLVHVSRGALLHDIGKMAIPDEILHKPGPLSAEEWKIMRNHPTYAYELISPISYLRPALDIPYCHHEKWDGTGYPRGLKGEQIPLAARIFAVVDVWDALRSRRPYREAWPESRVLAHIRSLAGTHFEARMVDAFLKMLSER